MEHPADVRQLGIQFLGMRRHKVATRKSDSNPMLRLLNLCVGVRKLANEMLDVTSLPSGFRNLRTDRARRTPDLIGLGIRFLFGKSFADFKNCLRRLVCLLIHKEVFETLCARRSAHRGSHPLRLLATRKYPPSSITPYQKHHRRVRNIASGQRDDRL